MIVFEVNIRTDSGKILLDELIAYASERFGKITLLFLDSRYQNNSIPSRIQIRRYCSDRVKLKLYFGLIYDPT